MDSPLQAPTAVAAASTVINVGRTTSELASSETAPTVETLDAGVLHVTPDARIAPDSARPTAPPLPARLATSIWLERLAADADRVQVSLGEDGAVRLRTQRQPDGVTVHLQFTDPEMQALASLHADRLREALETHFAEPVRLALPDASSDGAGTNHAGSNGADSPGEGAHTPNAPNSVPSDSAPDAPPHTSAPAADGRREWVG